MSTEITPERIAKIRETLKQDWDRPVRRVITKDNVRVLLDAIESAWIERNAARAEVNQLTTENQRLSDSLSKSIDGQIRLMQENIKWACKYFRSAFPSEFAGKGSEI